MINLTFHNTKICAIQMVPYRSNGTFLLQTINLGSRLFNSSIKLGVITDENAKAGNVFCVMKCVSKNFCQGAVTPVFCRNLQESRRKRDCSFIVQVTT